jgi:hypothetical protein
MQLAEFAASAVLLLLPYNQILATGMECKAMQCTAATTDTGANKTVCAIPKKKAKKIEKKLFKKLCKDQESNQSNRKWCNLRQQLQQHQNKNKNKMTRERERERESRVREREREKREGACEKVAL